MSEVRPQIDFSDDILTVCSELPGAHPDFLVQHEEYSISRLDVSKRRSEALETLSNHDGIFIAEEGDITKVLVGVEPALGDALGMPHKIEKSARIKRVLLALDALLPSPTDSSMGFSAYDDVDRVVAVTSSRGFDGKPFDDRRASVNHHFQRWLNQRGITEAVARETAMAMALPFRDTEAVRANFEYQIGDRHEYGEGSNLQFGVVSAERECDIELIEDAATTSGRVRWRLPTLYLHTDLPKKAVSMPIWDGKSVARKLINVDHRTKRLYEMTTENTDNVPARFLSLLLGLGTLAHHAAQYQGQENVVENMC